MLDTNILVSGLLSSKGNPAAVLTLVLTGAVRACHDKRVVAEYSEVLARPHFKFDPVRVREVLIKLEVDGSSYASSDKTFGLPDRDDEPFHDVALAAAADYLITGNMADYPPTACHGVRVISAADFVALWRTLYPDEK